MTASVIRAHAARLPLPDASVDLVICSPPYFGLRSYTDGGEHYPGQIGSEGTPGEWLDALWACTREWVRVLKPEGNLFVNLGDKYAGSIIGGQTTSGLKEGSRYTVAKVASRKVEVGFDGTRTKSLLGLPWRYAIGCTDQLGLILRAEIIWAKPNGLPESVTDRVRRAHEQVFHFTRQPRYYSAVDEIREPQATNGQRHEGRSGWVDAPDGIARGFQTRALSPLGKLPGSVWSIPSQPLQVPAHVGVDHFAAFPMELPRRLVLGWSPPGVCVGCGQGRRPLVARSYARIDASPLKPRAAREVAGHHRQGSSTLDRHEVSATITGYDCACPHPYCTEHDQPLDWCSHGPGRQLPPTRPAVVLDPFGGTGTTALVASVYGRHGITADLSADYCRLAAWRVSDPGERARALQVPKPPPVADGQEALFTL